MTPQTLPINEIKVTERQRIDLGDIEELAKSIDRCGQISPIIITKEENRLVDGKRRMAALILRGITHVEVIYKENLTEDKLQEIELEADIRRKDRSWQEKCIAISKIHALKVKLKAADSILWTQTQTAELLGESSVREISHSLKMARLLKQELNEDNSIRPNAKYWKCETISAAFTLLFREANDALVGELARRHEEPSEPIEEDNSFLVSEATETSADKADIDFRLRQILEQDGYAKYIIEVSEIPYLKNRVKEHYAGAGHDPTTFEAYLAKKVQEAKCPPAIDLSSRLIQGDSIQFMRDNPGRFDHVITDIPYGIDLDMISQSRNDFNNIDQVEELHDVEYNKKLITDFFPAAFTTMKDTGFCITWCDAMLWQYMYDLAVKAGFAVQRWPITWVKNTAMNQCTAYNTTKDTEIAIVCRKKKTTVAWQPNTSVIQCGKDELCNEVDHPFGKPFACWERLVKLASLEGQSILEPFAGRGTGVISMLQMIRNVVGVELDKTHYSHLIENVKRLYYLKQNPNYTFK